MKHLFAMLGRMLGLHFAPDNHVIPVLRLGRYHHVKEPGFFWIWPLVEQALPPVKTGLHVGNFTFDEVLSKDNIPFKIHLTVLFNFNPASAVRNAAAQLVKGGDDLLQIIVKDYTNQFLRRLASRYEAEELSSSPAMAAIEWHLTRLLSIQMRPLGLAPLKNGGILIKETIAPEKFKRAILQARRLMAISQSLASFPIPGLAEKAIQAGFVTGLEDFEGDLTLWSGGSPLETGLAPHLTDLTRLPHQNGHAKQNGGSGPGHKVW
ncbi:MAG: hypothetical protein BroJett011_49800 [Chloroflexota bacterium]|nr:MAG: hypothetical protein BroJett011_49800 [Chloroflexota bacterium]